MPKAIFIARQHAMHAECDVVMQIRPSVILLLYRKECMYR